MTLFYIDDDFLYDCNYEIDFYFSFEHDFVLICLRPRFIIVLINLGRGREAQDVVVQK